MNYGWHGSHRIMEDAACNSQNNPGPTITDGSGVFFAKQLVQLRVTGAVWYRPNLSDSANLVESTLGNKREKKTMAIKVCSIDVYVGDDVPADMVAALQGQTLRATAKVYEGASGPGLSATFDNPKPIGAFQLGSRSLPIMYSSKAKAGKAGSGPTPADLEATAIATLKSEGLWHKGHAAARSEYASMSWLAFRAACRDETSEVAKYAAEAKAFYDAREKAATAPATPAKA